MLKKKVLIVDDDEQFVNALKILLEKEGYNVVTAFDGIEAFEAAQKEKPDLITMDICLPQKDGVETYIDFMYSPEDKDVPVVFITSDSNPEMENCVRELGAEGYFSKPLSSSALLSAIHNLVS